MPLTETTMRSLRGLLVALVACLALAGPALANHEPPQLGLTPIEEPGQFFDLTLEPGETRQLRVVVANFGHDDVLARTYAADAYSIINGGFAADLFGDPASGTTLWLDYGDQEFILSPDEGLSIDFSVSVPEATPPGEYITALVAENVEPYSAANQGSVAMEQVIRTVVAVAIHVPGPRRPGLEIGAVGHKEAAGMSLVSFEVVNDGNEHLKPSGEFSLQDARGTELASSEAVMDSVYAGTETLLEAPLSEALRPGDYCAELSLADEDHGVSASTECLAFTIAARVPESAGAGEGSGTIPIMQPALDAVSGEPMLAALAALAGVMVLAALYLGWRRRRRSESPHLGGRSA